MSRITFSANTGGTGTFTIASTNAAGSQTITLPDETGTLVYTDSTGRLVATAQPKYCGTLTGTSSTTTNFTPTPVDEIMVGFTRSGTNLIVPLTGHYFVSAQQLVSTTGYTDYFYIRKNGVGQRWAYSNNDDTYDMIVTTILECAPGDTISFYHEGTVTGAWTGIHSNVSVIYLG